MINWKGEERLGYMQLSLINLIINNYKSLDYQDDNVKVKSGDCIIGEIT